MRKVVTVGGLLTVVCCALAWFFLAPASIGGRTTYVVTHGISMQPRFHTGDLAVLHAQPSYHVGEIVAYQSKTLHTVVMHRIVARDGNDFVFKGDNNSWLDPDHPSQNELLGSLSMQVRGGGKYLSDLHSPTGLAAVGGATALLLFGGGGLGVRHRRARGRRRRRVGAHRKPTVPHLQPVADLPVPTANVAAPQGSGRRTAPATWINRSAPTVSGAVVMAAAVLVASLAGETWLIRSHPTVVAQKTVSVAETGKFGYSATVPTSVVYPTGVVSTGDPIFTNAVTTLRLAFDYQADGSVTGKVALAVDVSDGQGWSGRLATGPAVAVTDGKATAHVDLDIAAARALLGRVSAVTGGLGGDVVTVTPVVDVTGVAQGQAVKGGFTPTLGFALEQAQLAPVTNAKMAASDALTATVPATVARTWHLAGHHIGVRFATIALAVLALLALLWMVQASTDSRHGRRAEADPLFVGRHYGQRLVDTEAIEFDGPVVELTSMAALSSIAERYDRVILHNVRGARHSYVVRDEVSWYRYQIRPDGGLHARQAAFDATPAYALAQAS